MTSSTRCFLVDKKEGQIERGLVERQTTDLPAGDVLIQVDYSAVNYKDGLAYDAHPGVAVKLPLVPGIDAVGTVVESKTDRCVAGDTVMVSGADFGTKSWGGWSTFAQVPADYCIKVPDGMSGREAAAIGTAGFTAAYSLMMLQHNQVKPDDGPILVSGATGGVGIVAVKLLSKLGYHVVAATGKLDRESWLKEHGAAEVVDRRELIVDDKGPLLKGRWAGAIDSVGGEPLATILRSTKPGGCVTACGLVAGYDLPTTVYPFILRGVTLQGIDSANSSLQLRERVWNRLATDLKLDDLESLITEVPLANVEDSAKMILAGKVAGRHLVLVKE